MEVPKEIKLLGQLLRDRRESVGLSLRDVSAVCNISIPTICRIERGIYRGEPETITRALTAVNALSQKRTHAYEARLAEMCQLVVDGVK